eukprot:gene18022-21513_t
MDEFINLKTRDIDTLVKETTSANKTMVYAYDGTRRSYLIEEGLKSNVNGSSTTDVMIDYGQYSQDAVRWFLEQVLMIFNHGITTIIYPMWFDTLEKRGPSYLPKFIQYLGGFRSILSDPTLRQSFMDSGIRVIFYGEYRELLLRQQDLDLLEGFEAIMELTRNNKSKHLLLGTNITDPSSAIIKLSIEFYQRNHIEPTKTELIKEYYGVEVSDVSFYFGFDKFSCDGRPILLSDKGDEDLYFSVSPHRFLTKQQFRRILFDHLYSRRVSNAKEYQLKMIDVEIMKCFYHNNVGNTMGVGAVQEFGNYWYPLPEAHKPSPQAITPMLRGTSTRSSPSNSTCSTPTSPRSRSGSAGSASSPSFHSIANYRSSKSSSSIFSSSATSSSQSGPCSPGGSSPLSSPRMSPMIHNRGLSYSRLSPMLLANHIPLSPTLSPANRYSPNLLERMQPFLN